MRRVCLEVFDDDVQKDADSGVARRGGVGV